MFIFIRNVLYIYCMIWTWYRRFDMS